MKYEQNTELRLKPAPNGGWIVSSIPRRSEIEGELLGAFSNAGEMLESLAESLKSGDEQ